ncbi:MAG: ferrous iron transport protein A [Ruminococcus sp.]|nr:ferrous iron transport protein A [Ruminococcus sp.]
MNNPDCLSSLREGESCYISSLDMNGNMRSRLMDLGFISGATAECVHTGSGGGLAAYLICGAVIALRKSDAKKIIIVRNGTSGAPETRFRA